MASANVISEKAICIYPAYINKKKTLAEGRRISKSHCCENPTSNEIRDVCLGLGLKAIVQDKLYPRELFKGDVTYRGRVRVNLLKEDGSLMDPRFPNKKALLMQIGDMVPKLKSRTQKGSGSSASTSTQKQNNKKGKKRR